MSVSQTLKLYQSTQDIAANTSKLRILWKSTQSGESHNLNTRTAKYWVSVNGGSEQQYTVSYTLPKGKTQTIADVTIVVPHDDLGNCTVKVRTWMDTKISAGVVKLSASRDMTPIPRANTISAADTLIGQTMKITVVRKSASYLHDILYSFQDISGKIVEKSAATEISFAIPKDWAEKMPNAKSAPITLTCVTYAGNNEIGRKSTTAKILTDGTLAPQLSYKVVDINPTTIALTSNSSRLIRGVSTARATLTATPMSGATIKSTKINGVSTAALEIESVQSGKFVFSATDSRGYVAEETANLSIIPYIPLTATIKSERAAQGTDGLTVTVKGNYYSEAIAGTENTLTFQYRVNDGVWQSEPPSVNGNAYSITLSLELDYQVGHKIEFRISDKLTSLTPSLSIPRAIPQTMEGEGWIRNNVPVYQVCPFYYSETDADESAFELWLDDLLSAMPNLSTVHIAWKCYPALGQAAAYGTLSRHTSANYAVLYSAAYDDKIYIKQKQNTWKATRRVVIE